MKMTFVHLAALTCFALLGSATGNATMCYSCLNLSNTTLCDQRPPENCTEEKPFCKIEQKKTGIPGINILSKISTTKGCASSAECEGLDDSIWKPKKHIYCCNFNFCNTMENMGVKTEEGDLSSASDTHRGTALLAAVSTLTILTLYTI
ncbi:hypothetical protein FKM82_014012 [Ascaphus truei]|uniref:prostate stem cell antigen-like n=1 Tax=Ascaphus truei TaxID=8439 RepID=UPI003F5A1C45